MTRRPAFALAAVIVIAVGGGYALMSIDRGADETTKVPKVVLPAEEAHQLETKLPPPGDDSIFKTSMPSTKFDTPPPTIPDMPDVLFPTAPPKRKLDGTYVTP